MLDGLHAGEVRDRYVLEDLVKQAPKVSLLASVDLNHLADLRKKEGVIPLSFHPHRASAGFDKISVDLGVKGRLMALPHGVMEFLNENTRREGAGQVAADDDLFRAGVLDSFSLVDLVSLLEEQCGVRIPDADVNPGNFQTIETIERYVESRKG